MAPASGVASRRQIQLRYRGSASPLAYWRDWRITPSRTAADQLLVSIHRQLFRAARKQALAGKHGPAAAQRLRADLDRAYHLLEHGLSELERPSKDLSEFEPPEPKSPWAGSFMASAQATPARFAMKLGSVCKRSTRAAHLAWHGGTPSRQPRV